MTQLNNERRGRSETAMDLGTPRTWLLTDVYVRSVITWQHRYSLLEVIWTRLNEKDLPVLFLFVTSLLQRTVWIRFNPSLLNCSARRKAQWRLRLSAWEAVVALQAEHSLRKTTQRMSTDHGPSRSQPANKATLTLKDHVFSHGTTTSTSGNPKKFGIVKLKEEKKKEKAKVDSKELVMCTLVKNKHKDKWLVVRRR